MPTARLNLHDLLITIRYIVYKTEMSRCNLGYRNEHVAEPRLVQKTRETKENWQILLATFSIVLDDANDNVAGSSSEKHCFMTFHMCSYSTEAGSNEASPRSGTPFNVALCHSSAMHSMRICERLQCHFVTLALYDVLEPVSFRYSKYLLL